MPEPRGLLLDFGGVLTTPVTHSFRAFCTQMGLPSELVKETFLEAYQGGAEDSPVRQVETGRITGEEFAIGLAASLSRLAAIDIAPDRLLERLFADVRLDEQMFDAVAHFRAQGVRTGLLSNSWGEEGYPRERFPELFDAVVISGEEGLRKPDPPIFLLAAERLGLEPQACVFVDDLPANVESAEQVGMIGVVHRGPGRTLPRLAELLQVALPAA